MFKVKKKKKKKNDETEISNPFLPKIFRNEKFGGAKKMVEQRFRTPALQNGRGSKQKYKNLAKPACWGKSPMPLSIAENAHVSILYA